VNVGVKIATAQKSTMAVPAGLILSLILVFIRLYLFLRESLPRVAKKVMKSRAPIAD
jgi:hypothetical protein